MNTEQIKEAYSMKDVLARYGLFPNRAGFVKCPFHQGDRQASMKVYDKDFHCFGCGENGDIFDFVRKMEHCDFKKAFYILGGTYEKPSFESKLAIYKASKKAEERTKIKNKQEKERQLNNMLITIYRRYMGQSEPLSDVWCDCYNALQYQLYINENLSEKR